MTDHPAPPGFPQVPARRLPGAAALERIPALPLVLAAILSVQFGGALAATLIPRVGVLGSVSLRLVLAAVALMLLVRPRLRGRTAHDWGLILAYGAFLGVMNATFYGSLARLPLGIAVTIEFLGPLLLAAVLSRRASDLLAVATALAGVVLISGVVSTDLETLDGLGVLLAATAGACWAGYILVAGPVGKRFEQLDGIALAMLVAAVIMAPPGIVTSGMDLLAPDILLVGLGIALLSSAIPYSLELVALRRIHPGVFGVLLSLEPAVAALAGFLVLSQTLSLTQVLGMTAVVAASAIVMGLGKRKRPANTSVEG